MIYLDNAATSYFKPKNSIKALNDYLINSGNPDRGVNPASLNSSEQVLEARINIARFFNFDKISNVIFTSGDTESLNTAINGFITKGDHVITTYFEHNSVLRPLYKTGCEISFINGCIEELKGNKKKNTKAVIINHASNVTGTVQDLHSIGLFCKENNLLFIVDSAQSAGSIDIDVVKDNIDILCFSSHKSLLGMQGLGGILINTNMYIKPLKYGGTGIKSFDTDNPSSYPHHLEVGTLNVPGIVFLNESIKYITKYGIDNIYRKELDLRKQLIDYLESKKNIEIYESKSFSDKIAPVVSFNIKGYDAAQVGKYFSDNNICVRTGAHCAPKAMEYFNITSCVRVSFGLNNTTNDVNSIIELIDAL